LNKPHQPADRGRKTGPKAGKSGQAQANRPKDRQGKDNRPKPRSARDARDGDTQSAPSRHPKAQPAADSPTPVSQQTLFRRPAAELSILYGIHAVRAALTAQRRKILAVFATPPIAERLSGEIARAGLSVQLVSNDDLARRLGQNAVHQGIMIEARPIEPIDLSDIVPRSGIVLALDQITDPHNVGAILRTAAAFDVDAVITTERHSPEFSGVMAKAASGGIDVVPIALVGNFARALERLADMGYLRIGLDSEAQVPIEAAPLSRPLALVLGGEGKGLRRLSREKCDYLVRLDMPGAIKSLNVSNACAVALTTVRMKLGLSESTQPLNPQGKGPP
jgi:23S rRNA (guanosine2251-2'-O)-methyltransferase